MTREHALTLLASLRDALRTPEGRRIAREIRALVTAEDGEDGGSSYAASVVARVGRARRR